MCCRSEKIRHYAFTYINIYLYLSIRRCSSAFKQWTMQRTKKNKARKKNDRKKEETAKKKNVKVICLRWAKSCSFRFRKGTAVHWLAVQTYVKYLLARSLTHSLFYHKNAIYILSTHIYHFSACLIALLHPAKRSLFHLLVSPPFLFRCFHFFFTRLAAHLLIISCWNAVTKDKINEQSYSISLSHKIDVHFDICKMSENWRISIDWTINRSVIVFVIFV